MVSSPSASKRSAPGRSASNPKLTPPHLQQRRSSSSRLAMLAAAFSSVSRAEMTQIVRPPGGRPFSVSMRGRRLGAVTWSKIKSSTLFTSSDTGSRSSNAAGMLSSIKAGSRERKSVSRTMAAIYSPAHRPAVSGKR